MNENKVILPPEIDPEPIYPLFLNYNKFTVNIGNNKTVDLMSYSATLKLDYVLPLGLNSYKDIENINYVIKYVPSNITMINGELSLLESANLNNRSEERIFQEESSDISVKKAILTENNLTLIFDINEKQYFNPSSFFKIQISFGVGGYYCSPLMCQATFSPEVVLNLRYNRIIGEIGIYQEDSLYSSYFILKTKEGKILERSEEFIYTEINKPEEQIIIKEEREFKIYNYIQIFTPKYDLNFLSSYDIEWHYQFKNGYNGYETKEIIVNTINIPSQKPFTLQAELDRDNAQIELYLSNINNVYNFQNKIIEFYKSKSSDNFEIWEKIGSIKNYNQGAQNAFKTLVFKDLNLDFGEKYQYSLEIIDSNSLDCKGYKIKSNIIQAWFEDSFLFDGKHQLKIAYNPRISSFKNVLKETKIEPIGAQYPIFFRNNNISYKEFNISGLLSYLQDEDNGFLQEEERIFDTSLSDSNVYKEKLYKNQVYDWLINGQPKKLKTPTEGNFTIRLMNVTMSPNDTLGRMLHSFNAVGSEIEDQGENFGIISADLSEKAPFQIIFNTVKDSWVLDKEMIIDQILISNIQLNHSLVSGLNVELRNKQNNIIKIIKTGKDGLYYNLNSTEPISLIKITPILLDTYIDIPPKVEAEIRIFGTETNIYSGQEMKINSYIFNTNPQIYHSFPETFIDSIENTETKEMAENLESNKENNNLMSGYYKYITFIAKNNTQGKIIYTDYMNIEHELIISKQLTCYDIFVKKCSKISNIVEAIGIFHKQSSKERGEVL